MLLKSEGAIYPNALLSHEAYKLCHEKEKKIERKCVLRMSTDRKAANRSHHERGESSGASQG